MRWHRPDRAALTIARCSPSRPAACSWIWSVRGADGTVLDTGAQDVEVPAIRGAGPALLQPQIVRARTARDFRTLSNQPAAAPSPGCRRSAEASAC